MLLVILTSLMKKGSKLEISVKPNCRVRAIAETTEHLVPRMEDFTNLDGIEPSRCISDGLIDRKPVRLKRCTGDGGRTKNIGSSEIELTFRS
jgi:hypothetical protein